MYGHVLLIVSGLLARHVGSVLQPADTAAALGKFTYDCQPPCQLTAAFFERGPEKQIKWVETLHVMTDFEARYTH
jgi:hypothetical protein